MLLAISPTGSITFISQARGDRVSDRLITKKSGFLDYICPGDVVMPDRGFSTSYDLAVIGAHLEIPASTRKKQLSMSGVERKRQLLAK